MNHKTRDIASTRSMSDWRRGFKKSSEELSRARRCAKTGERAAIQVGVDRIPEIDRRTAHQTDPTCYLLNAGFEVRHTRSGSISVRQGGNEQFRIDRQENGDYVYCDKFGNVGGDNIALVRYIEPDISFRDAVYRLISLTRTFHRLSMRPAPAKARKAHLMLPKCSKGAIYYGSQYLQGRGIDLETIKASQQQGFLSFDTGGVLFCGYDGFKNIRSITRRATTAEQQRQKSDYPGTDKKYPAILSGQSNQVVIVEGGIDALAVHTYHRRCGIPAPNVIVTGGAGVLGFVEQEHVRAMFANAEKITIYGENEKNPVVQAKTDRQRYQLAMSIQQATGKTVEVCPIVKGKDFADFNQRCIAHHQ